MPFSISRNRCWRSWKQGALLLILLSHAVFGSPVVPTTPSSFVSLPSAPQTNTLTENDFHTSLEEDVFGPTLGERADRKKRLLYETLKKAKQAKLLTIGSASGSAVKSVGKSLLKNIATFGIKAIIFNFLYSKINQVLDFKTRMLNNLEHKNREQNSQAGINDSGASGSSISTTTENPAEKIPEFDPAKVSLQVPDAVFGPAFNIANGASQVLGTFVQNTALRIARLFDALKPLLRSSSSFKSKKRETDFDVDEFLDDTKSTNSKKEASPEKSPVKSSFVALTQHK